MNKIIILKELPKLTKGNASKTLSIIFKKEHIYKNLFEKCKEIIIKHRGLGAKEYLYFDVSYNEGEKDLLLLIENDGNGLCGEFIVNNTNKNDYDYVITLLNILNQTLVDLIVNIRNEEGQMQKASDLLFFYRIYNYDNYLSINEQIFRVSSFQPCAQARIHSYYVH